MALYRLGNLLNLFREDFSAPADFKKIMTEIQKFFEELAKDNKRQRENEDIRFALLRIAGYLFVCNKYNCISCAKYVTKFLTHKSNIVSSFAASALFYIMEMVKYAIFNETDPVVRNGMKAELSGIISKIRDFCYYGEIDNEIRLNVENVLSLGQEILSSDTLQDRNRNFKKLNNNEALAISKILQLLITSNGNNDTVFTKIILNYLTNESDIVKDLAANTLIDLIKKSTLNINLENSPKRRKEISMELQEIFNELSNLIKDKKISKSIISKVNKALTIAKETLLMGEYRNNNDEYIAVNNSIDRLAMGFVQTNDDFS